MDSKSHSVCKIEVLEGRELFPSWGQIVNNFSINVALKLLTKWGIVGKKGAQWGILDGKPPVNNVEPNGTIEPIYNSLFRHGVDEKRRLQIPSKWRPARENVEFTLVLWPKAKEGPCIRVLPPPQMAALMRDIDGMPNSDPNKGVLKRFIGSESIQAAVDKAGRICLPEKMAADAGIQSEAVLVGLLDRFEIWSPEKYEKVKASDAIMAQEAFKLME
jgi:MraZ protein